MKLTLALAGAFATAALANTPAIEAKVFHFYD